MTARIFSAYVSSTFIGGYPFECIGWRSTDYVNVSNSIFIACDSTLNNSEMEIKNGRKNFVIDCTARYKDTFGVNGITNPSFFEHSPKSLYAAVTKWIAKNQIISIFRLKFEFFSPKGLLYGTAKDIRIAPECVVLRIFMSDRRFGKPTPTWPTDSARCLHPA